MDYKQWLAVDIELKEFARIGCGALHRIYVREDELDKLPDMIRAELNKWRAINSDAGF